MHRTLWLLRHAKTHQMPPSGGGDRQRLLAPVGEGDAAALREVLESDALGIDLPERVLFSEASRTMATARIVFDGLVEDLWGDARLYSAGVDEVISILGEIPDEVPSVGIVGHNPTIHALSLDLVRSTTRHPFAERFRPGELCVLSAQSDSWAELGFGDFGLKADWRLSRP